MIPFEDKLHASAQRMASQENRHLHVPQNPLLQKKTYWGWVATPAAAVVGLVFGMSVHLFMNKEPDVRYAQQVDTIRIDKPVHDTLYLTQIVEKEKIIVKQPSPSKQTDSTSVQEKENTPACTSVQCDGINYSILASI